MTERTALYRLYAADLAAAEEERASAGPGRADGRAAKRIDAGAVE